MKHGGFVMSALAQTTRLLALVFPRPRYDVEIPPPTRLWARWAALLLSLVATGFAVVLSLQQYSGLALPGCGPTGGCAQVAASKFGKLFGWPASHWGVAYAFGVTWLHLVGGFSQTTRWLIRLGTLGSIVFLVGMVFMGLFCPYCVGYHAASIAAWLLTERRPTLRFHWRPLVAFALAATVATVALKVETTRHKRLAEKQLQQSIHNDLEKLATALRANPKGEWLPVATTPRHLFGSPTAPIRITVFTDYQCGYCRFLEERLHQIMEQRDDVVLAIHHYPLCKDCNPYVQTASHPQACRAARVAEVVALVGGTEAFAKCHRWLMERNGTFTDDELHAELPKFGVALVAFKKALEAPAIEATIKADIELGEQVVVEGTPTVFINGVKVGSYASTYATELMVGVAATAVRGK
jgi:protein-disulfide isomerase